VIRVDREIDVDRPATEVFDRLTRIDELPRWQPSIVEAVVTSPGPIGVGSTFRIVVDVGGKRTEAEGTVVDFERPSRLGLTASAGPAEITARAAVSPLSETASRVALSTEIVLGGMLRFIEGMARGRIEVEIPAAADALKEWLEAEDVSAGS
jgi:uncharacterized protein YndB with AHSA1/START domain